MDKVIGQRVLGGVVLVAAAILFLPLVLEGAGVAALQPPEIPAKPATPTPGDLAPALQGQAAELEKNIADSHGEPTFYPVQPTTQTAPEATEDVPERFRLAEAGESKTPALTQETAAAKIPIAEKAAQPQVATKRAEKATVKAVPEASKVASAATNPEPKTPAMVESKPVPKAEPKPVANAPGSASKGLPSAWVVQVASLSSKTSADELVSRLRKRGFRASAVQHDAVFKVSVGPELDRAIAESLMQRLSADAELKLNGFIVPYRP